MSKPRSEKGSALVIVLILLLSASLWWSAQTLFSFANPARHSFKKQSFYYEASAIGNWYLQSLQEPHFSLETPPAFLRFQKANFSLSPEFSTTPLYDEILLASPPFSLKQWIQYLPEKFPQALLVQGIPHIENLPSHWEKERHFITGSSGTEWNRILFEKSFHYWDQEIASWPDWMGVQGHEGQKSQISEDPLPLKRCQFPRGSSLPPSPLNCAESLFLEGPRSLKDYQITVAGSAEITGNVRIENLNLRVSGSLHIKDHSQLTGQYFILGPLTMEESQMDFPSLLLQKERSIDQDFNVKMWSSQFSGTLISLGSSGRKEPEGFLDEASVVEGIFISNGKVLVNGAVEGTLHTRQVVCENALASSCLGEGKIGQPGAFRLGYPSFLKDSLQNWNPLLIREEIR